jgi:hypothetical protein
LAPLLIDRGRWVDVAFYQDPLASQECQRGLELVKNDVGMPLDMAEMRPRMIEATEGMVRLEAGQIVVALLAAKREPEARLVMEEVRRLLPGAETERTLLEEASTAGVTLP